MNISYYGIFLFSVFISSVSQIILKKSANIKYENPIREYLNIRVIVAYSIFLLSSFVTIYAYKFVPLSIGPVLELAGYIFVTVLGYIFLKERVGKKKLLGLACILCGIVVSNL